MSLGVVIADDQALVRAGFRMILETDPELAVLAEVSNGEQALDVTSRLRPDVVLMDIRMPEMDGLEATRRIVRLSPAPRVLILTTFDLDEYVFDALQAGASGFVLKDVAPESLIAAVHTVAAGEALLAPSVTRRLIEAYTRDHRPTNPPAGIDELTPGAGDPDAGRARAVERRDRRAIGRLDRDDQDPRRPGAGEARAARPDPGGRARLRDRDRAARNRAAALTGADEPARSLRVSSSRACPR